MYGKREVGKQRYREDIGRCFEDFVVGDVYEHRPGRTISEADNTWFTLLTMNQHPLHFDAAYGAATDFGRPLVNSCLTLSMVVGRARSPIRNLLQLTPGSVVELERAAGEPLDVYANGTLIAHGEVVVVNERLGVRLTDVVSPAERIKKLR